MEISQLILLADNRQVFFSEHVSMSNGFLKNIHLFLFYMCMCFAQVLVCTPISLLQTAEARR